MQVFRKTTNKWTTVNFTRTISSEARQSKLAVFDKRTPKFDQGDVHLVNGVYTWKSALENKATRIFTHFKKIDFYLVAECRKVQSGPSNYSFRGFLVKVSTNKQAVWASCKKHCSHVLSGKLFHTRRHFDNSFFANARNDKHLLRYEWLESDRERIQKKMVSLTSSLPFSSSLFLTNNHIIRGASPSPKNSTSTVDHALTGVVAGGLVEFCPSVFESSSLGGVCPRGSIVLYGSIHEYEMEDNEGNFVAKSTK